MACCTGLNGRQVDAGQEKRAAGKKTGKDGPRPHLLAATEAHTDRSTLGMHVGMRCTQHVLASQRLQGCSRSCRGSPFEEATCTGAASGAASGA